MTKKIASFRTEPYGYFIDLTVGNGRVGVDLQSGNVLLDEGDGPDCYQGAVIPARDVRKIDLESKGGVGHVVLHFGHHDRHELGITDDIHVAYDWVQSVDDTIRRFRDVATAVSTATHDQAATKSHSRSGHLAQRSSGNIANPQKLVVSAPELVPEVSVFSDAIYLVHPPVNYGKFWSRPEFEQLSKWIDRKEHAVCVLNGQAGMGKSTLATHFLLSNSPGSIAGYRSDWVRFQGGFYYSFYADPNPRHFMRALARWLRPDAPMPTTPNTLLALLRRAMGCLLVVDGIELLQDDRSLFIGYSLHDLLSGLSRQNKGPRVIVTTREASDLQEAIRPVVVDVGQLPEDIAISVLRSRGVDGEEIVLRDLVKRLGCHPLALDLAGHHIREFGWSTEWLADLETWEAPSVDGIGRTVRAENPAVRRLVYEFLFRFAVAAPEATQVLREWCAYSRPWPFKVRDSNDIGIGRVSHAEARLSWGLDVLFRSAIVTAYFEQRGHIGAARGGAFQYSFMGEKESGRKQNWKSFIQSTKVRELIVGNLDVTSKE